MRIEQTFDDSKSQALMQAAARLLEPDRIYAKIAMAAKNLTVETLTAVAHDRDGTSGFYAGYADNVSADYDHEEARVTIPAASGKLAGIQRGNPLAAHYFGAHIEPSGTTSAVTGKPITNLSIPVGDARATHSVPGDYDNLKVLPRKNKPPLLVQILKRAMGKVPAQFRPLFVLLKHVEICGGPGVGDKTILPTEAAYVGTIQQSLLVSVNDELRARGLA